MTWKINFTTSAEKEFSKLQKNLKVSIKNYLQDKVQKEPRNFGKPLVSSGSIKLWRYRIQNYRLICQIKDAEISVLVVQIGKRDSVYKNI